MGGSKVNARPGSEVNACARAILSTKYFDDETELVYYGYRFYSPELGRWLSRDPTGERSSVNLVCFVENDPVKRHDLFGLASAEEGYLRCNAAKGLWDAGTPLMSGPLKDKWNDYLGKFSKCKVKIECKKCCEEDEQPLCGQAQWFPSWIPGGSKGTCKIKICNNKCESGNTRQGMVAMFIHELTHCLQDCEGYGTEDCGSCICNEIQAYYAMNPSLTKSQLVAKAKTSCTAGDDAYCTAAEFDTIYNAVPDKTTYVWTCAVSGTSLPGFP